MGFCAMHMVIGNGAAMPALGFGTAALSGMAGRRVIEAALELGYRHIDAGQKYGNEQLVGAALSGAGISRSDLFITTKIWTDRYSPGPLLRSIEESLARLRTDRVDLLLLHWPSRTAPIPETMAALGEAVDRGWTRHIGVSNFPTTLLAEAVRCSPYPLVTNQVEYHPFLPQQAVLAACRAQGMAIIAHSPLAGGKVAADGDLAAIGRRYGYSATQIALRWLVQQDSVAAVPGSRSIANLRGNLAIFDFTLDEADMARIRARAHAAGRVVDPPRLAPAWDAD
jgi:diketogulonate reductase-like aldo/keto reductase